MYFARNDRVNQTINIDPTHGLQMLMHLQNLMPTVSSISLADTVGRHLRAPEVLPTEKGKSFDARTRPWFIGQAEASNFPHYTRPYLDYFTQHPTVTLYKPVISPEGRLKGTLAFHLDLTSMGYTLRQMVAPVQGEFFVVERDGAVVLHPDTGALFKQYVSEALMDKMTSGEGHLFDPKSKTRYYYYSFTNPDWFVIYRVSDATLTVITRHETTVVGWGFALAAIIIILFGLYLRHASRSVLMNIINAIKTGDVNRAPRLEAMLSHTIRTNKERELAYVRQATHDALTGCKNRRAFDNDVDELLTAHQPFVLALIDIDNFKSINDTPGPPERGYCSAQRGTRRYSDHAAAPRFRLPLRWRRVRRDLPGRADELRARATGSLGAPPLKSGLAGREPASDLQRRDGRVALRTAGTIYR